MIHNGIEYGLMQAYAEGFSILQHKTEFNLDLHQIAEIWRYGSVVRSWLLDLTADALEKNPTMKGIAPFVADSGEGRWTVAEAIELGVPASVITLSLLERLRSRDKDSFTDKLLAAMRNQLAAKSFIGQGLLHLCGDGVDTERIKQGGLQAHDLWQAAGIGGDHGGAAGHGLQGGQTKAFMPRGKDEQAAKVIGRDQFIVGHEARQTQIGQRQTLCGRRMFQMCNFDTGQLARKHQLMCGANVVRQRGKGLDQTGQVLSMIGPSGVKNEGPRDAPFAEQGLSRGFFYADGHKALVAGGRDIDHALRRNAEVLDRFTPG
jgi:hypothetical protein